MRGWKESKCSNRHGPQQKQHPDLSPRRCEGRGGFSTSEASPAVSVLGSLFSARGPGRGPWLRRTGSTLELQHHTPGPNPKFLLPLCSKKNEDISFFFFWSHFFFFFYFAYIIFLAEIFPSSYSS